MAAEGAHGGGGIPHIANWLTLVARALGEGPVARWLHTYEDLVFAAVVALGLVVFAQMASRKPKRVPAGTQNVFEVLVEGLNNFVAGIMGPHGRHFAPFIGTLFLYIWFMNLAGLVPGFKSPTADLNTTFGLALCVFVYIQWTGIRSLGFKGYFSHMMGEPRGLMMFAIGLLIGFIHLVGELVKPVSLAMRLGYNITGEDTFLAVAVQFGPVGILLQLMAMGLGLILGTAQALVFATLSAVFISMMLPHGEEPGDSSPSGRVPS